MLRRNFMLMAAAEAGALLLAGCTAFGPLVTESTLEQRRRDIDTQFYATLERFYRIMPDARQLLAKAHGILVFPDVIATGPAAGPASGWQYGEGALRVADAMVGYYSITSGSGGLQAETQPKAVIFLFMTPIALNNFRGSKEWFAGVDASVAMVKAAAGGKTDPRLMAADVLAFVLAGDEPATHLTVDGAKISPLDL